LWSGSWKYFHALHLALFLPYPEAVSALLFATAPCDFPEEVRIGKSMLKKAWEESYIDKQKRSKGLDTRDGGG